MYTAEGREPPVIREKEKTEILNWIKKVPVLVRGKEMHEQINYLQEIANKYGQIGMNVEGFRLQKEVFTFIRNHTDDENRAKILLDLALESSNQHPHQIAVDYFAHAGDLFRKTHQPKLEVLSKTHISHFYSQYKLDEIFKDKQSELKLIVDTHGIEIPATPPFHF